MTGAGKQAWVCLVCEVSTVAATRFPKCPKCGVRMVGTTPIGDKERIAQMLAGFARIKTLTKEHPATLWDDAYRRLANEIHTVGRECFWV
jgi:hypothetical protein